MSRSVFLDREVEAAGPVTAGDTVELAPGVARHLAVTRIRVGEEFDLVDGAGLRLRAVLADAGAGAAAGTRVRVRSVVREERTGPELVLVQALAKGERDAQAIEAATEIGVDRVIPWQAARSIAQWPAKKEQKAHARWRSLLEAATQQSRRSRAPELEQLARGRGIAARLREDDLVLVLHEEAREHLADLLAGMPADAGAQARAHPRIVLVVGPEGGISGEEIEAFAAAGARPVLLGPTVLRASSAGPAGLVLVQAALGRWAARGESPRPAEQID